MDFAAAPKQRRYTDFAGLDGSKNGVMQSAVVSSSIHLKKKHGKDVYESNVTAVNSGPPGLLLRTPFGE